MNKEEPRLDVTIRCYRCMHIHKTFLNIDVAVFIPQTLKEWSDLPCPICHSVGHELLVETHEQEKSQEP